MKKDTRVHDREKYPSSPMWALRISLEEREIFKQAARADGLAMATWMKRLARARVQEQKEES